MHGVPSAYQPASTLPSGYSKDVRQWILNEWLNITNAIQSVALWVGKILAVATHNVIGEALMNAPVPCSFGADQIGLRVR